MNPRRLSLLPIFVIALGVSIAWVVTRGRTEAHALERYGTLPVFAFSGLDGKPFGSQQLDGKVWIVDFIFTSCSGTCPIMSTHMAEVQRGLADVDGVRLVSITCDPERDTLERLAEYAKGYDADRRRWAFLRGDKAATQKFSVGCLKLGMHDSTEQEQREGMEPIVHSQRFVLVDRDRQIRGFFDGTDPADVKRLIAAARQLAH